jgi:hypothetical protein
LFIIRKKRGPDKYPLITLKYADYILFRQIIELMNRKEHSTVEGLSIHNEVRADKLKEAFPAIVAVNRPLV